MGRLDDRNNWGVYKRLRPPVGRLGLLRNGSIGAT